MAISALTPISVFGQAVSTASPRPAIVYVTDEEYPPFTFYENGKPSGFNVELMQSIAKVMHRKVTIQLEPFNQVLPDLKAGRIDVTDGAITEQRRSTFDFSLPIAQLHFILFVPKGSSIRSLNDARGKALLVENGDLIHSYLKRTHFTTHVVPVDNPLQELRLLNTGKYDGAFVPLVQGLYYIRKYKLRNIQATDAGFRNVDFAYIVKKGNVGLVRDINEGLGILKENGTYDALYDKWFGVYSGSTVLYERLRYSAYALVAILFLLLLSFLWSWSLRRRVNAQTAELAGEVEHRKKVEEALEIQSRALQDYIDRLTTMSAKLAPDGTILTINAAAGAVVDIPIDKFATELIGLKLWDGPWFVHSESVREQVHDAVRSAASGNHQRLDTTSSLPDGRCIQIELSLTPVLDNNNKVSYLVAEGRDVTDRMRAEEELRRTAQMLRSVLDAIPVRVFWKDKQTVYQGGNRVFAEDAGLTPDELVGKSDFDMPWPQQAENYRRDDRQVITSGESKLNYDELQTTRGGRAIWVRTSKMPLRDLDGQIIGVLGTYEDITPRKMAEQALKNSEQRLANIINFLPDPTFAIDLQGRVTLWNYAIERLTGVEAKEIIGKGNYEHGLVIYGERRPLIIDLVETSMPDEESQYRFFKREDGSVLAESHTPLVRPEGAYLWGKASPMYDTEGNVTGYIETLRDVTDRILAEQALRESEEKFRALAENTSSIIFITREGKFLYANPYFAKLLGYTNDELQSADALQMVHPDFRELVTERQHRRLLGEPVESHYEFRMLTKTGQDIWIDYFGTRIDYQGKPAIAGVGYDITQRKQADEEKRAFYRETILSATDGKLDIRDRADMEECLIQAQIKREVWGPSQLAIVRNEIGTFCREHQITGERLDSFVIGVGEAMDNSLKHAGGGCVYAGADDERVWVAVSDEGTGIGSLILPKAVLRRGYSTKPSLGLGYSIILQVADQILLSTGKSGTVVMLVKKIYEEAKTMLDSIPDTWDNIPDLK